MGDDSSSLRSCWLAEHHKLDPLGDAIEKGDEALQDGVIHCAAVHHKAVVVLKLKEERRAFILNYLMLTYCISVLINPDNYILRNVAFFVHNASILSTEANAFFFDYEGQSKFSV